MKLNNKGWGYGQMFLLMGILIIALIVVWALSYQLHYQLAKINIGSGKTYYLNLENKLKKAGKEYLVKHGYDCEYMECKIYYFEVKKAGLIDEMLDEKSKFECEGYIKSIEDQTEPYIKCDNYTTEGYQK